MRKLLKICLFILSLLLVFPSVVYGEDIKPGYSDWTTEKSGDSNEVSAIQYGRKLPLAWSDWSFTVPSSKDVRTKDGETKYYAYDGANYYWNNTDAKTLFTWNFGYKAKLVYFYADVDTYDNRGYTNYEAPPLQLYCDGRQIASVGKHDYLSNWNPSINTSCQYLELKMSSNPGNGRNSTIIVGTWATTTSKMYSYVTKWSDGQDWRFDTTYNRIYGENPQVPTQRTVYSHPIKYSINYNLDGGEFIGTPTYTYTINDEVKIPSAYKKGYDFLGFFDEYGNKVEKIEKGTYRDINLTARYDRKPPNIYVGYTTFEVDDTPIKIDDLVKRVNGKALDELDGDISDKIKISYITYDNGNTVYNPNGLDISKKGSVLIEFYVENSGGKKASVTRKFYILGEGEDDKDYRESLSIYSRYISEEYLNTLDDNSIWNTSEYKDELIEVLRKARKE